MNLKLCLTLILTAAVLAGCTPSEAIYVQGLSGANITGPQGPQGIPGTNGSTNLDQAVANSNLTGTTGYRLTWNGTNTVFLPPSFGGSLTYYLNSNNASDVATYFSLLDTVHNVTHNTSTAVNVGNTTLANFITQANNPGTLFIPAGSYDVHLHLSETGSKPSYVFAEIWETSSTGVDIAKIGTTENTPILTSTKTEYDIVYVDPNTYTLNSTASRINLRLMATATAGSASSVFIYCGGTDDSHISLPGTQVTINNFVPYTGGIKNITPSNNNTFSFGSTILKWLTGWFVNLVAETTNTTQLNVSGNTTFTGQSNNFTGPIYLSANGSYIVITNMGFDNGLDVRTSANSSYAPVRASYIYAMNGIVPANGLSYNPPTGATSYVVFASWNSTGGYTEVARLQNSNPAGFWQFTAAPKYSINSVSGPANNTTPVTWVKILLADNSTAYVPAYK